MRTIQCFRNVLFNVLCRSFRTPARAVRSPLTRSNRACGKRGPIVREASGHLMCLVALSLFKSAEKKEEESELDQLLSRADWLYDRYMIDVLYDLLVEEMERNRHPEILWRLARATFEKGKICRQRDVRIELFAEAMNYINEAVKLDGDISAVHKWYAILLDDDAKRKGTETRLQSATVVKEHLERALELNPGDATSWYILGAWFFTFADLPWYKRRVAKLLKYNLPNATYKMALDCFLTAEKISANFYSQNLLMIGKSYMRIGRYDMAKAYFTKLTKYLVVTVDDRNALSEAYELLKDKHVANAKDAPLVG